MSEQKINELELEEKITLRANLIDEPTIKRNFYKVDITEANGISDSLKEAMILWFASKPIHLLCEEGGPYGKGEHYHFHGVMCSRYNRTDNFRNKEIKPIWKKLEKPLTYNSVKIRIIKDGRMSGALSYCYKEKRVLTASGIDLDTIVAWKDKKKKAGRYKDFIRVKRYNFVESVCDYIDETGISLPESYEKIREIIEEMTKNNYTFQFGNWTKAAIGEILSIYGNSTMTLKHLDEVCHFKELW